MTAIMMKDFLKAIDDCEAALKVNAHFARAYQRLCKCLMSLGDFQRAKENIDKAREIDP
jgi:tetratricopeptide (TPR) repeat protein